jgi:hypothetical protein
MDGPELRSLVMQRATRRLGLGIVIYESKIRELEMVPTVIRQGILENVVRLHIAVDQTLTC